MFNPSMELIQQSLFHLKLKWPHQPFLLQILIDEGLVMPDKLVSSSLPSMLLEQKSSYIDMSYKFNRKIQKYYTMQLN